MRILWASLRWARRVVVAVCAVGFLFFCLMWVRGYFVGTDARFYRHGEMLCYTNGCGRASLIYYFDACVEGGESEAVIDSTNPVSAKHRCEIVAYNAEMMWVGVGYTRKNNGALSWVGVFWPDWVYAAIFGIPVGFWGWAVWRGRRVARRRGFPVEEGAGGRGSSDCD